MQALGAVEAGGPQLDPLEVRLRDHGLPRDRFCGVAGDGEASYLPAGEPDVRGTDAEPLRRDRRQPAPDLLAGVLDRRTVQVGARARRGGRGVGHLVGPRGREPDPLQRHAESGGGHLEHLGVQALAHLGATVVDEHRPVLVDVHERAALVEGGEVEGDAELHGRDRQRSLGVLVVGVELLDLRGTPGEVARVQQLLPDGVQAPRAAPAARTGWSARPDRGSGGAGRRRPARAAGRSGRGCPR